MISKKVLDDHLSWLNTKGAMGVRADFTGMDLSGLSLCTLNLEGANFTKAKLKDVSFQCVSLTGADFTEADLTNAIIVHSEISKACFSGANLTGAVLTNNRGDTTDFSKANLKGADLSVSNFNSAKFDGACLVDAKFESSALEQTTFENAEFPNYQIPQDVELIGYKKAFTIKKDFDYPLTTVKGVAILKLKIPAKAKRTASLIGNKCRAAYAEVIGWKLMHETEFHTTHETFNSMWRRDFFYSMGDLVMPHEYNDDFRYECRGGIHFFMNEIDAQKWN